MVKIHVTLLAQGDAFSPTMAEQLSGIAFDNKNEHGELGKKGRYRDVPTPFGAARKQWADQDPGDPTVAFLEEFSALVDASRLATATTMRLHLDVAYLDQCNMELGVEFVNALSRANMGLTITCYES